MNEILANFDKGILTFSQAKDAILNILLHTVGVDYSVIPVPQNRNALVALMNFGRNK